MHPEVAAVLRQAQQLQSLMDEQLHKMNTQTFTASDEPTPYRSPSTGISTSPTPPSKTACRGWGRSWSSSGSTRHC